ncbi:MAG: FAD-dependent oxidoreductase, partial [Alphaproteobacteria bacterium]|nr:FAD-dependent oxidoreductase [Alphaproteobacteria bacterium]
MKIQITNHQFFDDIVIGGGGAGLTAAIKLAEAGRKVAVLSKTAPIHSATAAAQGGINANFGNQLSDDWRWHMYDTIKASGDLADIDATEILCKNANQAVEFLQNIGVKFDLDPEGKILQKVYGGQTINYGSKILAKRACSAGDRTGSAIINALAKEASLRGVIFCNYIYITELIYHDYECYGAKGLDINTGNFISYFSKNTIIATGGYGQIFGSSTSPKQATGDGAKLIAQLGLSLKNMEFVQFHPTVMENTDILISETARSIGGYLLNGNLERFMAKYSSDYMELDTRDIVARAIFAESSSLANKIYLDLRHVDPDVIRQRLGYISDMCQAFLGLDLSSDLLPVKPAVHYCMGGIPANKNCQVLDYIDGREYIVNRLYTIGEAACNSVHGAGRLGCNSLLEIIVFGIECANYILDNRVSIKLDVADKNQYIEVKHSASPIYKTSNDVSLELKKICDRKIGIIRNHHLLEDAITDISKLENEIGAIWFNSDVGRWDLNYIANLELESMIICAKHTAYSALARLESRGAHYRSDFPSRNNQIFSKHSFTRNRGDTIEISYIKPS